MQATYEAMRSAINNLNPSPDILLNDAVTIPKVDIKQVPIIKGDAKSISIAAASVLAKVTRDRIMEEYDKNIRNMDLQNIRDMEQNSIYRHLNSLVRHLFTEGHLSQNLSHNKNSQEQICQLIFLHCFLQ